MPASTAIASFMFHEVTDDPTSSGFQRPGAMAYKHTLDGFRRCLDALAEGTAAPSLVSAQETEDAPPRVLVTFDDGGHSALTAAAELEQRGWLGHFFVVTSLVGTVGFLDGEGIRRLRRAGHIVGSHSHTHPNIFREQPPARMAEEWRVSCDRLAQLLGEPCLTASVPGGDISARVLASADAAGLRYLFTSEPVLIPHRVGDCLVLGRFSVKASTPPDQVRRLARFRGWTGARVRRRLKVLATRAVPPLYRLYIRARTRAAAGPVTPQ
jgi:peptidoglycan/xylan/chitin deacetylase (PgdA/CDA1 family)